MTSIRRKKRQTLVALNASCAYCGIHNNLTLDHIKPLSLGGTDRNENLQLLCELCNTIKGCAYIKNKIKFVKYLASRIRRNKIKGNYKEHAEKIITLSKNQSWLANTLI